LAAFACLGHAAEGADSRSHMVAPSSLTEQVARYAGDRLVPLVVASAAPWPGEGSDSTSPDVSHLDWLPALQAIAASVSPGGYAFVNSPDIIPFRDGSVWTLAPDVQRVSSLDAAADSLYAATGTYQLTDLLAHTMSAAQMAKATASGMRWSDWTPRQQEILTALFRRWPTTGPVPMGDSGEVWRTSELDAPPVDLRQSVLHLYLAFEGYTVPDHSTGEDGPEWYVVDLPDSGISRLSFGLVPADREAAYMVAGSVITSNRDKPGDLNFAATALNAPIGRRGVLPLRDVVDAAAKASRIALLVPDGMFEKVQVFVGDPALRSGDVLRALALDVRGAWRKVGDTWLLAYDRVGDGAYDWAHLEGWRRRKRAEFVDNKVEEREGWTAMALAKLRPQPGDPLAPLPSQGQAYLRQKWPNPHAAPGTSPLSFARLTTGQQEALAHYLHVGQLSGLEGGTALTVTDLEQGEIEMMRIRAVFQAPGIGTAQFALTDLYPVSAQTEVAVPLPRQQADWPPTAAVPNGTLTLPEPVRALAAPMLPPADWPRLIRAMQQKGLNTLYFPVFWDGQTPFASRYFPERPATIGLDTLNDVLVMAKAAHIRVVGVIHTLAWRFPGGGDHWLARHPEWVDVDAAGRTRYAWATPERIRSNAHRGEDWAEDPLIYSDMVRPTEPRVKTLLMALISELTRYPDLDGLALDHWTRETGSPVTGPLAPFLGFALPERNDFLARWKIDPVDLPLLPEIMDGLHLAPYDDRPWQAARDAFPRGTNEADVALASQLITMVERRWPGRAILFDPFPDERAPQGAETRGASSRALPRSDVVISSHPAANDPRQLRWLPMPKPSDPAPADYAWIFGSDFARANEDRLARAAARIRRLHPGPRQPMPAGVVLDFTTAPDLLWPMLRLLADTSLPPPPSPSIQPRRYDDSESL
jgi:hypothetical protein